MGLLGKLISSVASPLAELLPFKAGGVVLDTEKQELRRGGRVKRRGKKPGPKPKARKPRKGRK